LNLPLALRWDTDSGLHEDSLTDRGQNARERGVDAPIEMTSALGMADLPSDGLASFRALIELQTPHILPGEPESPGVTYVS
jgi:hypothetical protein